MPIESRICSGLTPARSSSGSVSWAWVTVAGCTTSDLESPTLARKEKMVRASMNRRAGRRRRRPVNRLSISTHPIGQRGDRSRDGHVLVPLATGWTADRSGMSEPATGQPAEGVSGARGREEPRSGP